MRALVTTMAAGLLFALPALADELAPQRLQAMPGVPLPLAVESAAQEDCSLGASPEMTVIEPPAHGELTVREGRLRRTGSACPAAPGFVVIYIADADFNGPDAVTLQVVRGGRSDTLTFDITIRGKVTPPEGGV